MTKTVICSHGFGVKADARGLFTEIAAAFPEYPFTLFDYNEVMPNGDTILASIASQVQTLQDVLNKTSTDEIVLLCHSQGAIVAALADLSKVSKVILTAPPLDLSAQRILGRLTERPGSKINLDGVSVLPRTDGTTTFIPKEYLSSLERIDPLELFIKMAAVTPTIIVRAVNDEVLGKTDVDKVIGAKIINIQADHDFTGESRQKLIEVLEGIL